MKEIHLAAASTTVSSKDRRFLFQEFQQLHEEVDRIVQSTEYNGVAMLSDKETSLQELAFLVGEPLSGEGVVSDLKENPNFYELEILVISTVVLKL